MGVGGGGVRLGVRGKGLGMEGRGKSREGGEGPPPRASQAITEHYDPWQIRE